MNMRIKFIGLMSAFVLGGLFGCAGTPPGELGVDKGKLAPCPASPNCVSTQAAPGDQRHFIAPIAYTGERQDAFSMLSLAVQSMDRAKITERTEGYLRTEFTSPHMGFVDDVEFYFPEEPVIHVRSASRKGYSDLGVNRKRIERIRILLSKRLKATGNERH